MRILHESPEYYIQQCNECGAVLQYSKNDIFVANIPHFIETQPYVASFDFIICPSCGQMIPATKEWFYGEFKFANKVVDSERM